MPLNTSIAPPPVYRFRSVACRVAPSYTAGAPSYDVDRGWTIAVIALTYAGRWLENKLERIELLLMDINDIVKDLDYLAEQGRKERLFQAERELDRL